MTQPTPEEDDIKKQQLWKRIDEVFPVIANVADQLQPQITNIREAAMTAVKNELDEFRKEFDAHAVEIDEKLNAYTKKINTLIYNALRDLSAENARNIQTLQTKIRDLQSTVPGTVTDQAMSFLQPAVSRISEIASELEGFKKAMTNQIAKFQTENIAKVSSLNAKMENILNRLRKIAAGF